MKQGKINWFDVATTMWAIGLVLAAVVWVATPAFAGPGGNGGGDGPDCLGACAVLEKCSSHGGCFTINSGGGECWGECGDGTSWSCGYEEQ